MYYTALDWDPKNRDLLDALLHLLVSEDDAAERADVLERRLAVERGPGAEAMALSLAEARANAGDESGAERALALGFEGFPASRTLYDRLEQAYRARGDWRRLAELYTVDASTHAEPGERAGRLREAAAILHSELGDARAAAKTLRLAREAMPGDVTLLGEHVNLLVECGDHGDAAAELTRAIDAETSDDGKRAALFASRASVHAAADDPRSALDDLESAFVLEPETYAEALAAQLERARASAAKAGDDAEVRVIRLRLSQVMPFAGDLDGARAVLGDLLRRDPKDRQALRTLAILEGALDRWEASSAAWRKLVALEEGEAAVEAALALAEACEHAGRPGDARGVLERAHLGAPQDRAVRDRLERLYEATAAWHELAELALGDAHASGDVAARFAHLVRGGTLLVSRAGDPEAAVAPLEEALALRPGDFECVAPLADAYVGSRRPRDAMALLDEAMATHKGRRARELAPLHVRVARTARALGDWAGETRALVQALECDAQNGEVCAEVAERAIELDQLDLASRALRAVTLLKTPGPMAKAVAFQLLGDIARRQGDPRKALALLRRAVAEDPALEGARSLIDAIERG